MSSFLSSLPTFTIESLIANGQWVEAQNKSSRKNDKKDGIAKKPVPNRDATGKQAEPTR